MAKTETTTGANNGNHERCEEMTLDADDIIRPCSKAKGHDGWHMSSRALAELAEDSFSRIDRSIEARDAFDRTHGGTR